MATSSNVAMSINLTEYLIHKLQKNILNQKISAKIRFKRLKINNKFSHKTNKNLFPICPLRGIFE